MEPEAPDAIAAYDIREEATQSLHGACGIHACASLADLLATAPQVLVLAVKPQHLAVTAKQLVALPAFAKLQPLVISIAAGVSLATLADGFPAQTRLMRVMPNINAMVGHSATAFAAGSHATQEDRERTQRIFDAVGFSVEIEEKLMDAVTGLSGSGPAYMLSVVEAMSDGGVRLGLPRHVASKLALHTMLGAARYLESEDTHPAVLRERITSPGGTTIAGLQALEEEALHATLMKAVMRAAQRAEELRALDKS